MTEDVPSDSNDLYRGLVDAYSAGTDAAWTQAISALWSSEGIIGSLQRFLAGKPKSPKFDAEDVLQEVFVKILQSRHTFDPDHGNLSVSGWIYSCVEHQYIEMLRKANRHQDIRLTLKNTSEDEDGVSADSLVDHHPSSNPLTNVSEEEEKKIESERLARALARLTPDNRQTILLWAEDYKIREIAAALKLPEGTVKSRYHNIIPKLRQLMEDDDGLNTVGHDTDISYQDLAANELSVLQVSPPERTQAPPINPQTAPQEDETGSASRTGLHTDTRQSPETGFDDATRDERVMSTIHSLDPREFGVLQMRAAGESWEHIAKVNDTDIHVARSMGIRIAKRLADASADQYDVRQYRGRIARNFRDDPEAFQRFLLKFPEGVRSLLVPWHKRERAGNIAAAQSMVPLTAWLSLPKEVVDCYYKLQEKPVLTTREESRERVIQRLEHFSDENKNIIHMVCDGKPRAEISQITGIPRNILQQRVRWLINTLHLACYNKPIELYAVTDHMPHLSGYREALREILAPKNQPSPVECPAAETTPLGLVVHDLPETDRILLQRVCDETPIAEIRSQCKLQPNALAKRLLHLDTQLHATSGCSTPHPVRVKTHKTVEDSLPTFTLLHEILLQFLSTPPVDNALPPHEQVPLKRQIADIIRNTDDITLNVMNMRLQGKSWTNIGIACEKPVKNCYLRALRLGKKLKALSNGEIYNGQERQYKYSLHPYKPYVDAAVFLNSSGINGEKSPSKKKKSKNKIQKIIERQLFRQQVKKLMTRTDILPIMAYHHEGKNAIEIGLDLGQTADNVNNTLEALRKIRRSIGTGRMQLKDLPKETHPYWESLETSRDKA